MDSIDLTRVSFGDVINKRYDVVVLPWGAIEPHNYHLPYTTDAILSHAVAVDAAQIALGSSVRSMVLPPVYYGSQNPGQRELPFCVHGKYSTQWAILLDIVSSLYYQGFRKMIIVNGHGGNSFKNMLRDLAVEYPDFMLGVCDWFSLVSEEGYFEEKGEHAHELETSVMLHYHPELVDMSQAGDGQSKEPSLNSLSEKMVWMPRNWQEITDDTGIGDPRKATAEKGARYAKAVSEAISRVIIDFVKYNLTTKNN